MAGWLGRRMLDTRRWGWLTMWIRSWKRLGAFEVPGVRRQMRIFAGQNPGARRYRYVRRLLGRHMIFSPSRFFRSLLVKHI